MPVNAFHIHLAASFNPGSLLARIPWDSGDIGGEGVRLGARAAYITPLPGVYFFAAQYGAILSGTDGLIEIHITPTAVGYPSVLRGLPQSPRGGQIARSAISDLIRLPADTEVSVWSNNAGASQGPTQDWFWGLKVG